MTSRWNLPCDPLEALRDGDSGSFEAFVPMGLTALVGFFRRQGASREDAEDLSQDVLMKLVQNAKNYQPDGRFAAYVFRIGRNAWVDSRRRAGARPKLTALETPEPETTRSELEPVDPAPLPGMQIELADEAARVRAGLVQLSLAHREVFELGVLQELPYHEISVALDVPIGTVKSRMFHALRALRAALETPKKVPHEQA